MADILVIEDDQRIRELVCRHLAGDGYGVTSESTGLDGLRTLTANPPMTIHGTPASSKRSERTPNIPPNAASSSALVSFIQPSMPLLSFDAHASGRWDNLVARGRVGPPDRRGQPTGEPARRRRGSASTLPPHNARSARAARTELALRPGLHRCGSGLRKLPSRPKSTQVIRTSRRTKSMGLTPTHRGEPLPSAP